MFLNVFPPLILYVCFCLHVWLLSEATGSCRKQRKSCGPLGTEAQPCQGPMGVTRPSCGVRLGHGKASLRFELECWQCAGTVRTAAPSIIQGVCSLSLLFYNALPWRLATPPRLYIIIKPVLVQVVLLCYCCCPISANSPPGNGSSM